MPLLCASLPRHPPRRSSCVNGARLRLRGRAAALSALAHAAQRSAWAPWQPLDMRLPEQTRLPYLFEARPLRGVAWVPHASGLTTAPRTTSQRAAASVDEASFPLGHGAGADAAAPAAPASRARGPPPRTTPGGVSLPPLARRTDGCERARTRARPRARAEGCAGVAARRKSLAHQQRANLVPSLPDAADQARTAVTVGLRRAPEAGRCPSPVQS